MFENLKCNIRNSLKAASGVGYHVAIIILSTGIAFSLPFLAGSVLTNWSVIVNGKVSLLSIEIGVAVFLILLFNFLHQSFKDRQIARMAAGAGLLAFFAIRRVSARKKIRKLKETHGRGRNVKVLGSSGYASLVDQVGDLSCLLGNCLGAKILLMNPYSSDASKRVRAVADPDFTLDCFRDEVKESIQLLKRLKDMGKNVKLKLYSDPPLIKLVILGDYLWLQHYHSDLDVQMMPEYVFQHHPNHHGLYAVFHQYFSQKWENHAIPDYDLDKDELVYRGLNGEEIARVAYPPEEGHEVYAKHLNAPEVRASFTRRPSSSPREHLCEVNV